jgi:5-methylcytosine-specific restriction endonuclease McrA
MNCLVLTPWMSPHQSISWQEAVTLVFLKKADVLEEYEATVSSPSMTIQLPAVLRLKKQVVRMKKDVKFSRVNVYQRDSYTCQYCCNKKPASQLNYDHVIPRSRGGKTVWENIVTSCVKCNLHKDNRTPEEAGMRLLRKPQKPKSLPLTSIFVLPREVPEEWLVYLHGTETVQGAVG